MIIIIVFIGINVISSFAMIHSPAHNDGRSFFFLGLFIPFTTPYDDQRVFSQWIYPHLWRCVNHVRPLITQRQNVFLLLIHSEHPIVFCTKNIEVKRRRRHLFDMVRQVFNIRVDVFRFRWLFRQISLQDDELLN